MVLAFEESRTSALIITLVCVPFISLASSILGTLEKIGWRYSSLRPENGVQRGQHMGEDAAERGWG
jgi:hypothetical protein